MENLEHWQHEHSFSQDQHKPGEKRMIIVIMITAVMMVIEIAAGMVYGSMALLSDGLHMGSHAVALSVSAFAYIYARKHAHSEQFNFGTGKVNALGGFTGAVLLAVFAAMMAFESTHRLLSPVEISFDETILVAIVGLLVNLVCYMILGHKHHDHGEHSHTDHNHTENSQQSTEEDHNLKAAYLHVLADAMTSVLAIAALLAGKFYGLNWLDPTMGIVGALLISHWSIGLIYSTSEVLLDKQPPQSIRDSLINAIEQGGEDHVADLHVWSIGSNNYAVEMVIVSKNPRSPNFYKALIPQGLGIVHINVELHHFSDEQSPPNPDEGD